jgi:hypothetical protein
VAWTGFIPGYRLGLAKQILPVREEREALVSGRDRFLASGRAFGGGAYSTPGLERCHE